MQFTRIKKVLECEKGSTADSDELQFLSAKMFKIKLPKSEAAFHCNGILEKIVKF